MLIWKVSSRVISTQGLLLLLSLQKLLIHTDDPAGVDFPYEGVRNGQTKNDRSAVKYDELGSDHAQPYTVVGAAGPKWFVMRAFRRIFPES